jgi:hypothetical protein
MRALIVASSVFLAAPAFAQDVYCEAVVETSAGEVIAGYTLHKDGKTKSSLLSWMPERDKYESFDAEFMTSPRLMLHYRLGAGGRLAGPSDANVVTTRFSMPDTGGASPLSQVLVEATAAPSGKKISWKASEARKGEPLLAKLVMDEKPARITIKLLERGKVTANAEFDLAGQADVGQMAVDAKARADRDVAAYRKLLAEGKAGRDCPSL